MIFCILICSLRGLHTICRYVRSFYATFILSAWHVCSLRDFYIICNYIKSLWFVIVFKSFLRNFMRPSYYLLTCKLICSHVSSLRDLPNICWVLVNCRNLTILLRTRVACYELYLTLPLLFAFYFRFIVITKDCLLKVRFPIITCVVCSFYIYCSYQRLLARGSISHYCLRCMFVLYLPKTSGAVNLRFLLHEHYYLEARLWGIECMTKQR